MRRNPVLVVLGMALFSTLLLTAQDNRSYARIIHAEVPLYPAIALAARVSGKVEIDLEVKAGTVVRADVRSGNPLLAKPTVENIKTWRFSPKTFGNFMSTFEYRMEGSRFACAPES
jgi:outer membrane biosynthesis protein TonB